MSIEESRKIAQIRIIAEGVTSEINYWSARTRSSGTISLELFIEKLLPSVENLRKLLVKERKKIR